MIDIGGTLITMPKMSGMLAAAKGMSGSIGGKTINIGGKGDDGATFIPSVSADGVISWTNDKQLPNPEPVNIKGKDGKNGIDGKNGYTPVKGKDYFTDSDKTEMVSSVIARLPVYDGSVTAV